MKMTCVNSPYRGFIMRAFLFIAFVATSATAAEPAWRSDYSAARKEALEANKAVCLVVGSENCFYCKKLESVTMTDAAVTALLQQSYVAIKIDGGKEAELMKALKVQLFPTTVLAGADGTIHAIINGYVTPEQMREHLKHTLVVIADDEKLERDLVAGKAAYEAGDLPRSAALLRSVVSDFKKRPAQAQAKELLEKIDLAASTRAAVQAVRPPALVDVARQLIDS